MESDSKGIKLSERLHMEDLLLGLCLGAKYDDATFQLNTQCRKGAIWGCDWDNAIYSANLFTFSASPIGRLHCRPTWLSSSQWNVGIYEIWALPVPALKVSHMNLHVPSSVCQLGPPGWFWSHRIEAAWACETLLKEKTPRTHYTNMWVRNGSLQC